MTLSEKIAVARFLHRVEGRRFKSSRQKFLACLGLRNRHFLTSLFEHDSRRLATTA